MQASNTGRRLAWVFLVAMGVANIAGYAFDLYSQFAWFDRALHACTIFAITLWLALFVFGPVIDPARGRRLLVVLLLANVGIGIGALWEVAEWAFDQVAPGDVIKGKHDTILDIIMDTAGALAAAALAVLLARPELRPSRPGADSFPAHAPRAGVET